MKTRQRTRALDDYRERPAADLDAFVREQVRLGALALHPDPNSLLGWFRAPGLAAAVAEARVLPPWLWDLGEVRQLVYGLGFRRAA